MTSGSMNEASSLKLAKRDDLHLARKAWHMCWGVLALSLYEYYGLSQRQFALICIGFSVVAFIFDYTRLYIPSINKLCFKYFGAFMREGEAKKITGIPFYALGMGLSLYFFSEKIALLSILYLIFSDPLSSLCGILFGKVKIIPNKSLEGSFAGFCVCYTLTLLYADHYGVNTDGLILFSLIAGVIGSFSELVSAFKIDDNLTIPVLSGLGLTLCNHFFQIF